MPKAPWLQDVRACHKFTIWNNKTIDWIICKEYLGIGDGQFLNLFRLCLDAKTGFSHKIPSSPSLAGGVGGWATERSEGATKNLYP